MDPGYSLSSARFIYGCSTTTASFGAALGKATKIDVLVKVDASRLIKDAEERHLPNGGCLDQRSIGEILCSTDTNDPIKAFHMPRGWYAQEATFVSRSGGMAEDDGFLLFYAFDESQLKADGECREDAKSELWIVCATTMDRIIAKIRLPQRVPYGMHGAWFSEFMIKRQRPVKVCRGTVRRTISLSRLVEYIVSWLG